MLEERIRIPEGIDFSIKDRTIIISGPKGQLKRSFDQPWLNWLSISAEDRTIVIKSKFEKRKHKAMVGTVKALIRNAIKGVTEGWTVKMKIVYAHFPISVKVEGRKVIISNFLGEKAPRVAEIVGDAKVRVEGDEVIVEGIDKYEVGQTALNIENATKIKRRDPRVFQDGIYRIS